MDIKDKARAGLLSTILSPAVNSYINNVQQLGKQQDPSKIRQLADKVTKSHQGGIYNLVPQFAWDTLGDYLDKTQTNPIFSGIFSSGNFDPNAFMRGVALYKELKPAKVKSSAGYSRFRQKLQQRVGQRLASRMSSQLDKQSVTPDTFFNFSKRLVDMSNNTGSAGILDTPQGQQLQKKIQSRAWQAIKQNPLYLNKAVSLWLKSKNMETAGQLADNPLLFYGSLLALLGFGAYKAVGAIRDRNADNYYNGRMVYRY